MTTLRALALLCCLAAFPRRPVFGAVAGIIGAECVAGELAERASAARLDVLAALLWASPSALAAASGASLGRCSALASLVRATGSLFLGACASLCAPLQVLTSVASCAVAFGSLASSAPVRDKARLAALLLFAGNIAGGCIALVCGTSYAYSAGLILSSNSVTHAAIMGLALWTLAER